MEEKKTIFDYLAQVMIVFGFSMLVMNVFCLLFGNSARELSAMFVLGAQGIPTAVAFQFLCVAAMIVGLRFVFLTDTLIRRLSLRVRTVCMLLSIVVLIAAFVAAFDWFPTDMWQAWVMFLLCLGLCFVGSCLVVTLKERAENKKMENALRRLKGE